MGVGHILSNPPKHCLWYLALSKAQSYVYICPYNDHHITTRPDAILRRSNVVSLQDMLDKINRNEWRQLLFVMTFLHSVVQERRKYGPIGWNVPYEFNLSDLSACVQFLQVCVD